MRHAAHGASAPARWWVLEPAYQPAVRTDRGPLRSADRIHLLLVGVRRRWAGGEQREPPSAAGAAACEARTDPGPGRDRAGSQPGPRQGLGSVLPAHLPDRIVVLTSSGIQLRRAGPGGPRAQVRGRPD